VPDFEAAQSLRIRFLDLDAFDARSGRTFAHQIDKFLDRLLVTFELRFDGTVAAIAHPAINAERLRLVARPGAEEDALHPAYHPNSFGDLCHSSANARAYRALPVTTEARLWLSMSAWKCAPA